MRYLLLLLPAVATVTAQDLLTEPLRVPAGESRPVTFGTVPQQGTTVLLELQVRLDYPTLGGSMYFCELELNGQPVRPVRSRTVQRLVNRPLSGPVTPDLVADWYGSGGWRVIYAPDFAAGRQQTWYQHDPYTLVLDVTDLTNPAAENRLQVTNTAKNPPTAKATMELVVGRLRITTRPEPSPTMAPADLVQHRVNRGEPGAGPAPYTARVAPGGGLTVAVAGRELAVATAVSFPRAGFNRLGVAVDPTGQPGWRPTVTTTADGGTVTAAGADYELVRTVRCTPRRVEVRDRFTNRHADQPLGLLVRHELDLRQQAGAAVRLAGNGDPAANDVYAPANPTVHVGLGEVGLGLVAEDDVFRNQARLYCDPASGGAGLRTAMLLLQPGGQAELVWSLYLVASPEYYDFLNLLRADWGANLTVEGAWCFFQPDAILKLPEAELAARLERLGIRYACSWGGWVDPLADPKRIGFGAEVASEYWRDYRRRLREATARLHAARPGLKVLIYYDSQRDTAPDAGQRYPDSLLTDSAGRHLSTDWSGRYSLTWSMVATRDNSYGRAMLDLVDLCFDELGADGLYWDEMENVAFGTPLLTWSIPDGKSCVLDPQTLTIQSQVGLTTLLGESHRLAVIERVRQRGGVVMGNGPTTTRALLRAGVQRMLEIQHNDFWHYQGHLNTPLGYGSSRADFGNVTRALDFAMLLVGTRTDYVADAWRYLFPFTPLELHPGYLLGRERLITRHSGRYGWPGETVPATLRRFDREGRLTQEREVTVGPERLAIDLGEGELAVLSRR